MYKIARLGLWGLLASLLVLGGTGAGPRAQDKTELVWGSTSTASGTFAFFPLVAGILNDNIPEINVTVRATGANVHNTRLLQANEIDMGMSDTKTASDASEGKWTFEGNPFPDLRLLYVLHKTNPLQFVVRQDSGVETIADLEGKPFTPGIQGSTAESLTREILLILEVEPDYRPSGYADAIEAVKEQRIVGFAKFAPNDSSILEVFASTPSQIVSFSDEQIDTILANVKGVLPIDVAAGMYPDSAAFRTVQNQVGDMVRKDFPEELAYKIVKTIWEHRLEIAAAYPNFPGADVAEQTLKPKAGVYLHPGAVRFYREIGYEVPEGLIPPEMK